MLNGVISIPNVALALINGLLIDRYGPARVAFWSAAIGVLGAALTAVGSPYELMVAGRFIFGVSEGAIFIALIAGLAQWFPRSGIALATALYLSLARTGSYAVDTSTAWAHSLYDRGWQAPLWLGTGITLAGLIAALIFYWLDRRHRPGLHAAGGVVERINWAQVLKFDRSYWYILALHVLYAAVFFPFRTTYAIEYFQHAKGLSLAQAGVANSWVFFAAIFATPFFGLLADRFGHRALMLIFGTLLLPVTFVVLGLTSLSLWVSTVMMGISFSLVPAVIWPATTLIVEPRRLGTALGLITLIQALGMAASESRRRMACRPGGCRSAKSGRICGHVVVLLPARLGRAVLRRTSLAARNGAGGPWPRRRAVKGQARRHPRAGALVNGPGPARLVRRLPRLVVESRIEGCEGIFLRLCCPMVPHTNDCAGTYGESDGDQHRPAFL